MFWLGLLLPICFVPGYTGASIPTQWAVLSIVLPATLWRGTITPLHLFLCAFIAYACLTCLWAPSPYTSVLGLWYVLIWVLSFHRGTTLSTLVPLWKGLAIGLALNIPIALSQCLGYYSVETAADQTPGLLFNSTILGACCALVLIALAMHKLWWYTPPLILGLIIAQSRGAFLVLAITAFARISWLAALAFLIFGSMAFTLWLNPADSQRLVIWGLALQGLSLWGWGPDSFNDVYYLIAAKNMVHAEFVHNDYLQLAFEFGIGGGLLLVPLAAAATQTSRVDWPPFFAFAILATFYFPLYTPLTAFIGLTCAGHLLRGHDPIWHLSNRWRSAVISWCPNHVTIPTRYGRDDLPMVP